MRLLFVVCGEGLGHASRSTKLAKYLEKFGHKCYFASYGKALNFISKQGFTVFDTYREVILEGESGYFSLSKTVWSSKGVLLSLARSLRDIRRIIIEKKIDVLIADTMYAAVFAAKIQDIPSLFITNQNKFASANDEHSKHWEILSSVVEKYLTLPDNIIIPDFSYPNTVSAYNLDIKREDSSRYKFVGPIMDAKLSDYKIEKKIIFASFGGEPFKIPMYGMLKEIANERPFHQFEVFSTSPGLPAESRNFKTHGYTDDILSYMAQSRVNILHGGLTSIHESLFLGKPIVMIIDPYHPEQWNNGRKIEEIGAGIMLPGDKVTKETLSDAIDEALNMKVPDMSYLFVQEDGRVKTMAAIEDAVRKHNSR
ncbi:MAG: glycosyl transferase family 28 [Methanomicrobium sp.]|nr:glycosyl transferase family 28 [Methanomicrobium sp.]